jgi:hypothetical protein
VGHARARKIPAQLVEDEEYQLRHERVAGIDIAKAKADVCTRLPPQRDGGRRASRVEEVPAAAKAILALAVRLIADGVELVVMESTSVIRGSKAKKLDIAQVVSWQTRPWRGGKIGSDERWEPDERHSRLSASQTVLQITRPRRMGKRTKRACHRPWRTPADDPGLRRTTGGCGTTCWRAPG